MGREGRRWGRRCGRGVHKKYRAPYCRMGNVADEEEEIDRAPLMITLDKRVGNEGTSSSSSSSSSSNGAGSYIASAVSW